MKVFVTGGTGFLGKVVVAALLGEGHAVRVLVRDSRRRLPQGAESVVAALDRKDDLVGAMRGCDAVVHLAGKVSRDPADASGMFFLHVECTQILLAAMAENGIRRMILASTSGTIAVSDRPGRPATEENEAPLSIIGRWPYYTSKRLQEQLVVSAAKSGGLEAVILNPSLLLGPGDDHLSSTGDVLKVLLGRIPAITAGTVAFVDVRDCAPAFCQALTKGQSGRRYLLNGSNLSVRSFCQRIASAGDVAPPPVQIPDRWAMRSARILESLYHSVDRTPPIDPVSVDMSRHHWGCNADRAMNELGFSPRDPQQTITDTVRFLEEKGLFRRR